MFAGISNTHESSYLFSALHFSLSSHALISDSLFSVATRASTVSEKRKLLLFIFIKATEGGQ